MPKFKGLISDDQIEQVATFLRRLQQEKAGDKDLLAQSLVMMGAGIGDGDRHNHDDLPILLAGGGGGAMRGDRHVAMARETPLANLYVTVLRTLGVEADAFGDSTGTVI